MNFGAGAELDKVEKEDEAIVEQVQKGVKSRFYDRGKFSPSMETGVHHFHLLLSKFMIIYRIMRNEILTKENCMCCCCPNRYGFL